MFSRLDLCASRGLPIHPLAFACLVAGCGGGDLALPDGGDAVASIEVVDGDGQRGSVGQPLDAPIVVQVSDAKGDPVEGAAVEFALTSAGEGAGITPSTARTDGDGRAKASVLLGDKVGVQTGEARVAGDTATAPRTTFSALAASAENRAPIADFGWSCEDLTCQFSQASTDGDGSVTAWAWRFGDGSTSGEREPAHTYPTAGTFTVRLEVTDDQGARDELADEVRVTAPAAPPSNQTPRADFDVSCQNLTCSFTDRSEDEDGTVASRRWDFGDGGRSSERHPSHRYESAGRYDVVLTVVDDDGAEDSKTGTAEPVAPAPPPNGAPQAEFEVSCQDLRCSFVDRSEDDDGNIVSRRWSFGDGAGSTERSPSHTYAAPGRYDVTLTVTDDDGSDDSRTRSAEPTAPAPPPPAPNEPPDAEFEVQCQEQSCTFVDRSTDRDGSIVSWQWNFGDGSSSTERNPSHTYAGSGRFDVLLVVTDDDGAADTRTHSANPQAPPPPEPNRPPHADFDVHCEELSCTFTDKSKDDDGAITGWQWTFGDGTTSSEQNPVHTYAEPDEYEVLLTVTDDDGATDTRDREAKPDDD